MEVVLVSPFSMVMARALSKHLLVHQNSCLSGVSDTPLAQLVGLITVMLTEFDERSKDLAQSVVGDVDVHSTLKAGDVLYRDLVLFHMFIFMVDCQDSRLDGMLLAVSMHTADRPADRSSVRRKFKDRDRAVAELEVERGAGDPHRCDEDLDIALRRVE